MKEGTTDWCALQRDFTTALSEDRLSQLANEWGVSAALLKKLGVGWSKRDQAYTFPEHDHRTQIVGIMLRDARTGKKRTVRGSKRGLYFLRGWRESEGPILLPEGVSDTAALLAHGLAAVGRPSCKGGVELLADLLDGVEREIIVLGENDAKQDGRWPGRDGATEVAERLANVLDREVKWTLPPEGHKDVRDWLREGGEDGH
jgi:hypothetical protein